MTRRRYQRIPGTNLAVVLPRQPWPPHQEIVVSTPRPPAIQVSHTDYRKIESAAEIQLRFLTALFNFLSQRR
jgi:hypothetical protein